jgi:Na+/H+-dicarboxylate symporter
MKKQVKNKRGISLSSSKTLTRITMMVVKVTPIGVFALPLMLPAP